MVLNDRENVPTSAPWSRAQPNHRPCTSSASGPMQVNIFRLNSPLKQSEPTGNSLKLCYQGPIHYPHSFCWRFLLYFLLGPKEQQRKSLSMTSIQEYCTRLTGGPHRLPVLHASLNSTRTKCTIKPGISPSMYGTLSAYNNKLMSLI